MKMEFDAHGGENGEMAAEEIGLAARMTKKLKAPAKDKGEDNDLNFPESSPNWPLPVVMSRGIVTCFGHLFCML